jgi:hypothetical protein
MVLKRFLILSLWVSLSLSACASSDKLLPLGSVPATNNEEIVISKPYDFVYLSVFDVVNGLSKWTPEKTLKDEGLIALKNTQFSRFDDSDNRNIHLRIRRDNPKQTSVYLDPDSRRVIGADEVLLAIRKKLGQTAIA